MSLIQLVRYGLIGVGLNASGYLIYLAVTALGLDPKLAVAIFYPIMAVASFLLNRRWTFQHKGSIPKAGVRYILAHVGGYLLNLLLLFVFVDVLGLDHRAVQGAAIFVVAGYLFISFKLFVFSRQSA